MNWLRCKLPAVQCTSHDYHRDHLDRHRHNLRPHRFRHWPCYPPCLDTRIPKADPDHNTEQATYQTAYLSGTLPRRYVACWVTKNTSAAYGAADANPAPTPRLRHSYAPLNSLLSSGWWAVFVSAGQQQQPCLNACATRLRGSVEDCLRGVAVS